MFGTYSGRPEFNWDVHKFLVFSVGCIADVPIFKQDAQISSYKEWSLLSLSLKRCAISRWSIPISEGELRDCWSRSGLR